MIDRIHISRAGVPTLPKAVGEEEIQKLESFRSGNIDQDQAKYCGLFTQVACCEPARLPKWNDDIPKRQERQC